MDRETLSDKAANKTGASGSGAEKPRDAGDPRPRDTHGEFIETVKLTPEEETARKRRNLAIAFGLVAFIVLIFLVTVVRMTSNYSTGAAA